MLKGLLLFFAIAIVGVACLAHFNHASSHDVFIGDSLTYQWHFPRANDGIYGQTSAEILNRVPSDLAGHHYGKAFFLAGTNDVLLGLDPAVAAQNIEAMGLVAQQAGVQPILCTLPPVFAENGRFMPAVDAINTRINQIASAHHWLVVDYYGALRNHPHDMVAGIHMKRRSYLRMELALLRTTNPF